MMLSESDTPGSFLNTRPMAGDLGMLAALGNKIRSDEKNVESLVACNCPRLFNTCESATFKFLPVSTNCLEN